MFFRLGCHAVHMVKEGILDRLEGEITDFQITGSPLPDLVNSLRIGAFDFSRIGIAKPSMHLDPAFAIGHIMGSDFLERQSSPAEKLILSHFLKAATVQFMPQPTPLFHMGEHQKELLVIAFEFLDSIDQCQRAAAVFIFVLIRSFT